MSLSSIVFGSLIGLCAVAIIGKCAEERFHSVPRWNRIFFRLVWKFLGVSPSTGRVGTYVFLFSSHAGSTRCSFCIVLGILK